MPSVAIRNRSVNRRTAFDYFQCAWLRIEHADRSYSADGGHWNNYSKSRASSAASTAAAVAKPSTIRFRH